jgi:hypothetical protein
VNAINATVMATIIVLIAQFYVTNPPGLNPANGARYDIDKNIGTAIKEQSTKDEIIFMSSKPSPQVVFYAGRNIKEVGSIGEAEDFMKQNKATKGVYFDLSKGQDHPVRQAITLP